MTFNNVVFDLYPAPTASRTRPGGHGTALGTAVSTGLRGQLEDLSQMPEATVPYGEDRSTSWRLSVEGGSLAVLEANYTSLKGMVIVVTHIKLPRGGYIPTPSHRNARYSILEVQHGAVQHPNLMLTVAPDD